MSRTQMTSAHSKPCYLINKYLVDNGMLWPPPQIGNKTWYKLNQKKRSKISLLSYKGKVLPKAYLILNVADLKRLFGILNQIKSSC